MFRMTQVQRNKTNWWIDKTLLAVLGFLAAMTLTKVDGLQVAVARIEGREAAQRVIDDLQNKRLDWIQENK